MNTNQRQPLIWLKRPLGRNLGLKDKFSWLQRRWPLGLRWRWLFTWIPTKRPWTRWGPSWAFEQLSSQMPLAFWSWGQHRFPWRNLKVTKLWRRRLLGHLLVGWRMTWPLGSPSFQLSWGLLRPAWPMGQQPPTFLRWLFSFPRRLSWWHHTSKLRFQPYCSKFRPFPFRSWPLRRTYRLKFSFPQLQHPWLWLLPRWWRLARRFPSI